MLSLFKPVFFFEDGFGTPSFPSEEGVEVREEVPDGVYLLSLSFEEDEGVKSPHVSYRGFVVAPSLEEAKRLLNAWAEGKLPSLMHPQAAGFSPRLWPEESPATEERA